MDHHQSDTGVVKNFTLTAFLSFAIMFCLFVLLSNCKGNFVVKAEHHGSATEQHHNNEAKPAHNGEHH